MCNLTLERALFVKSQEIKTIQAGPTSIHVFHENAEDLAMEPMMITQTPRSWAEWLDGKGPSVHEGEEIHYGVKGTIVDVCHDREYYLEQGDYFYFQGPKPHTWHNPGREPARLFIILAPALSARTRMREFGARSPEERTQVQRENITKAPVLVRRKDFQSHTVAQTTIDFPTPGVKDQKAEIIVQTTGPKARFEYTDGRGPFRHEGEEFLYVLEGALKAKIGNEVRVLDTGDYTYFPGTIPHEFENTGETPVKTLIGESPPITVRPDYYDHLNPEDREYAYKRMREFGITPPG